MTPEKFIETWLGNPLSERAGAQGYVDDLCDVLKVDKPRKHGQYQYEYGAKKAGAGDGFADVWKQGYFGWENKKPGRDLKAALKQLTDYSLSLENPPLLVVCDRERIEIHTAFTGYPDEVTTILLSEIGNHDNLKILKWVFEDPEKLKPKKSTSAITEEAAGKFAGIAESMRGRGIDPQKVAHFLIQCLFCMFAEDEGLLPNHVLSNLLSKAKDDPGRAAKKLGDLFRTMRKGGDYGDEIIDYFNGGLFSDIDVPELEAIELSALASAAIDMDWRAIEPAIFGTLFERGLNPKKRSQLGAHYTDQETIMRIIDAVIKNPLLEEWEKARLEISDLSPKFGYTGKDKKIPNAPRKQAMGIFHGFLDKLRNFRVLDPACGSGNFLYLSLKTLKDIEKKVNFDSEILGLQRQVSIECSPANVMGIELDPYAAELARVTVWIGELQWMLQNGYEYNKNPILKPLHNIENRDALIDLKGSEAEWPNADVVVGNPPFIGDKKMIRELGKEYVAKIRELYKKKITASSDFVCYWFSMAQDKLLSSTVQRVGLVATNVIARGANRKILSEINNVNPIYNVWSDQEWVNDGAAVRVSLICFSNHELEKKHNGENVDIINADLTSGSHSDNTDLTRAKLIPANKSSSYFGLCLAGDFKIPRTIAIEWLKLTGNPNGRPNSDVIRPIYNGSDITARWKGDFVIDFASMTLEQASDYLEPFKYVETYVKPERIKNNRKSRSIYWWIHGEKRPGLRAAMETQSHYIATPETAKHRFFVRLPTTIAPEHSLIVFPWSDYALLGVLSCRFHSVWTMATGSPYGNHPTARRYNATVTFEKYPLPQQIVPAVRWTSDAEEVSEIRTIMSDLDGWRESWLNPNEWIVMERTEEERFANFPEIPTPKPPFVPDWKKRTLTSLYNEMPAGLKFRHEKLDKAVANAYGWKDYTTDMSDDEILRRLLELNSNW